MNHEQYWQECITQAAEECGVVLTKDQVALIADHVHGAHENYGMAFYQPDSPYPGEIKRLEAALAKEREKIVCPNCLGEGSITIQGPYHSSTSRCYKCNGEGKISP